MFHFASHFFFFLIFIKVVTVYLCGHFINIWLPPWIIDFTRQVDISLIDHHSILVLNTM